jgi:hypothetical protein
MGKCSPSPTYPPGQQQRTTYVLSKSDNFTCYRHGADLRRWYQKRKRPAAGMVNFLWIKLENLLEGSMPPTRAIEAGDAQLLRGSTRPVE